MLLSYPKSGVNELHKVIALNYLTLVCKAISLLVEMMNFSMVKVDNIWKNKLTAVYFLMKNTQEMFFPY